VHLQAGNFAIITHPGITIRTPWHEAYIDYVPGPGRFDCWLADGALHVCFGRRELIANRLPYSPAVRAEAVAGE
jgi:hypothetical protein